MIQQGIKKMEISSFTYVVHQIDLQAPALLVDVVEDFLIDPNARARISDSVATAMTSALRLSLCAKEDQYSNRRILIKDYHIVASMRKLSDDGLARALTRDNTFTKVPKYLVGDKRISREVANMAKEEVGEHSARVAPHATVRDQ